VDEIRRVVRVLCDYITLQCSRPPPHHSKDLHSTIVAAFSCCASWLFSHPDLVADFDCLSAVLQVIELGISGSKSQVICFFYCLTHSCVHNVLINLSANSKFFRRLREAMYCLKNTKKI
jgi:hypothetical protein